MLLIYVRSVFKSNFVLAFLFALNYLFDSCFAITVVESNLSMAI